MSGILYISYSGMTEPLGQSQVLSYLERLARHFDVHLISFEKPLSDGDADVLSQVEARIDAAGINWHPLRYHNRPSLLGTAYDIAQAIRLGSRLVRRHKLQLVHCRTYISSVAGVTLKRRFGIPYVFDMRGFWPDERVDSGLWPRGGAMYRLVKRMERHFLDRADAAVTLTEAAAEEIRTKWFPDGDAPPLYVIPTCADLARFRREGERMPERFTLGYVGSLENWYRFDEALACFRSLKAVRPNARLMVVNRGEHEKVRALAAAGGIDPEDLEITAAAHADVPRLIKQMSAGVLIARPAYSQMARAPTRLAEFLGCGLPFLANDGIGDVTRILEGERVGVIVRGSDEAARREAVTHLIAMAEEPSIALRCARVAECHFSVDAGAERYRAIYESLGVTARG